MTALDKYQTWIDRPALWLLIAACGVVIIIIGDKPRFRRIRCVGGVIMVLGIALCCFAVL